MRIVASIFGIVIMFAVLLNAFVAMVPPRRATRTFRPARLCYRAFWYVRVHVPERFKRRGVRQHFLSFFGPLLLFAMWVPIANPGDHLS